MFKWKGMKKIPKINGSEIEKDKYFELSVNANNWRKTSFSLIVIIALLIGGLIKISVTNKVETFVIEKNGNNYSIVGNVSDVAQTQKKASEEQIIYFLNEVISNTKNLTRNTDIYEKNYKKSLSYLSRNTSIKIDNYLKSEKYAEKVKLGKTVEVKFNTGIKINDSTYQLRWSQTTFKRTGEIESTINYNGLFSIAFKDIENSKELHLNPLGLIITDFVQKSEML
ncbi:type IV secretion system protein [Cetobacterium sp. 2A]|uniref:type IV secretion system protein n=1 Tax=Cetobacterium sp. 2A TaxID=2754723 RepID=UPI00163C62B0|nr:type IV secretion system protein [Cetobacterium sp. 2A]MBC2857000.1 type IV secretion system protein [Cetobacterium sp. 2A]